MADTGGRIRAAFLRARALDGAERERFLSGLEDPGLRAEVEDLLEWDDSNRSGVHTGVLRGAVDAAAEVLANGPGAEDADPERVGRYRIVRRLGEGGMGTVYLAEQEEPIRRRVALKLIKLGMDSRRIVRRFESERQTLSLMNHPGVAKVFDAGTTDRGRPYFVMEYIEGIPIDAYCDEQSLDVPQRLRLFLDVCDAVQHAHQNAVIHRDLKPNNVLVSTRDGRPHATVIDFGVAKATEEAEGAGTQFTRAGEIVGTPQYMSPEQCGGDAPGIDTRSDVYALGVMLYGLLTGELPFADTGSYPELFRAIAEQDPPRPSIRVRNLPEGDAVARTRGTTASGLVRQLEGDLDWILLKTMEKGRERRYQTVGELAADIGRLLRDEPVLATPPSVTYRARKFARRNRGLVMSGAVVVLSLIGATAFSLRQAAVANDARRAEAEERAKAEANLEDIQQLTHSFIFDFDHAIRELPGALAARQELVRTAREYLQRVREQAPQDPVVLRDLAIAYRKIGEIQGRPGWENLGDQAGAIDSYTVTLEILEPLSASGVADSLAVRELILTRVFRADLLDRAGRKEEALEEYERAYRFGRAAVAADSSEIVEYGLFNALRGLGDFHLRAKNGDLERSLELYTELLDRAIDRRDRYTPDHPLRRDVAVAHNKVGDVLKKMERYEEALEHYLEGKRIIEELVSEDENNAVHRRDLAISYEWVSLTQVALGNAREAIEPLREALRIRQRSAEIVPDNYEAHRDIMVSCYSLCVAYVALAEDASSPRETRIRDWEAAVEWGERLLDTEKDLLDRGLLAADDAEAGKAFRGVLAGYRDSLAALRNGER